VHLRSYDGRLGEALIGLGLAERSAVSRAVRNLSRDRVASLCGWREGHVQLYRGSVPSSVELSLDLDLGIPMMAAAVHAISRGETLGLEAIVPGRRYEDTRAAEERGSAPSSLLDLLDVVAAGPVTIPELSRVLAERGKSRERVVSDREAHAAVMVAIALEWVRSNLGG
jgi:hypothetical protein